MKIAEMENRGDASRVIEINSSGEAKLPVNQKIVVGGKKGGYGSGVTAKDPVTGIIHPKTLGTSRPVFPTGQDPNARVVMRYNVLNGKWEPVTHFPTDESITP